MKRVGGHWYTPTDRWGALSPPAAGGSLLALTDRLGNVPGCCVFLEGGAGGSLRLSADGVLAVRRDPLDVTFDLLEAGRLHLAKTCCWKSPISLSKLAFCS